MLHLVKIVDALFLLCQDILLYRTGHEAKALAEHAEAQLLLVHQVARGGDDDQRVGARLAFYVAHKVLVVKVDDAVLGVEHAVDQLLQLLLLCGGVDGAMVASTTLVGCAVDAFRDCSACVCTASSDSNTSS